MRRETRCTHRRCVLRTCPRFGLLYVGIGPGPHSANGEPAIRGSGERGCPIAGPLPRVTDLTNALNIPSWKISCLFFYRLVSSLFPDFLRADLPLARSVRASLSLSFLSFRERRGRIPPLFVQQELCGDRICAALLTLPFASYFID